MSEEEGTEEAAEDSNVEVEVAAPAAGSKPGLVGGLVKGLLGRKRRGDKDGTQLHFLTSPSPKKLPILEFGPVNHNIEYICSII